jgi:hypothetical protein
VTVTEQRPAPFRHRLRVRERRDAMVGNPAAHRREVISSQDTGEPGSAKWEVEPRYGPLGVLMNWWRVKVSGGAG